MIRRETIVVRGTMMYRTYSDEGRYIVQVATGREYAEAIDVREVEYVESDKRIEDE